MYELLNAEVAQGKATAASIDVHLVSAINRVEWLTAFRSSKSKLIASFCFLQNFNNKNKKQNPEEKEISDNITKAKSKHHQEYES